MESIQAGLLRKYTNKQAGHIFKKNSKIGYFSDCINPLFFYVTFDSVD